VLQSTKLFAIIYQKGQPALIRLFALGHTQEETKALFVKSAEAAKLETPLFFVPDKLRQRLPMLDIIGSSRGQFKTRPSNFKQV